MFQYPQYGENGEEILHFPNIWRNISPQEILGADCFTPYAPIYNDENLISLNLTGLEYRKILSSLMLGSQIAYPQEWMQILVNWLKGTHCPPVLVADECKEYPPYSPFLTYLPQNPYSQPDLIPEGYLTPPFVLVTEEDIELYPQNEIGDIVVPFGAITFDVNWFEDVAGALPTITLQFNGTGQANIRLLNQAQGGLAIITLDNPPNLVEIIAGIISGADNIIDTNLDIVSLPPETAVEHIFPVEITTGGLHTVYVVFFPIIDDSLIPLRFGGGFRGVELCGELEVVDMGVTDIRLRIGETLSDNYMLEKQVAGDWVGVVNWDEFMSSFLSPTYQSALDGVGIARALRNLEPYEGFSGEEGWPTSALKEYIDSAAIFDPSALEADIAAAAAAAAAAQSTANGAVSVNTTQTTNINNLDNRLDAAEADISVLTGDVVNLYGRMNTAENNIGALAFGGIWAWYHDFSIGQQGYVLGSEGSYSAGVGFRSNSNGLEIVYNTEQIKEGNVGWLQCTVLYNSGATGASRWKVNGCAPALFDYNGVGVNSYGWYNLPPNDYASLTIEFEGSGDFYLLALRYLGRGANLPFD